MPSLDPPLWRPARSLRGGSPSRPCRARARAWPGLAWPSVPTTPWSWFAQDVGMSGVPAGLGEEVDHDVEQLHVRARPPRHVAVGVDRERLDRRVRVLPCAPVAEAEEVGAGGGHRRRMSYSESLSSFQSASRIQRSAHPVARWTATSGTTCIPRPPASTASTRWASRPDVGFAGVLVR